MAQTFETLNVELDSESYKSGDIVTVSGNVSPVVSGQTIVVQVYNPLNRLTRIDPVSPSSNGTYSYSYKIDGPLNTQAGTYRVAVTYSQTTKEKFFTYTPLDLKWSSYSLRIGERTYEIIYSIEGGSVRNITGAIDLDTLSIIISSRADGLLTMRVPVGVISEFGSGPAADPEVFIDTIPAVYTNHGFEECSEELAIPFIAGTEEIEIVRGWLLGSDPSSKPVEASVFDSKAVFKVEGEEFDLPIRLNALDCELSFHQEEKRIHLDVVGSGGEDSIFQITIPHRFLGGNYTVLAVGKPIPFESEYHPSVTGQDSSTISFRFNSEQTSIDIVGSTAIPEFWTGAAAVLAGAWITATLAILHRRRS
jgi:hypothetical protein